MKGTLAVVALTMLPNGLGLRAQTTFCRDALRARPLLEADSTLLAVDSAYPQLVSLERSIVRRAAEQRVQFGFVAPLSPSDIATLVPEGVQSLATDSAYARATADVLTYIMASRGGGPGDQAELASLLYAEWRLPPGPVMTLVKATWARPESRTYAILALGSQTDDASFFQAAADGFCSLAARSAGLAQWLGLADTVDVDSLLDDGELNFLFRLVVALNFAHAPSKPGWRPLRKLLPERNPVSAYVRQWGIDLW